MLRGFDREERALFCPSMRHGTSKVLAVVLQAQAQAQDKQILDMPLDMLGLELALSADAANVGKHEAKRWWWIGLDWIGLDWI